MRSYFFVALVASGLLGAPMSPQAAPLVSARRITSYDELTGATIYTERAEEHAAMGSVAKTVTIHVAIKAVQDGKIALTDKLKISTYSASLDCQCFDDDGTLAGGERMTVKDALYATAISDVEPTVSLAEYVANVVNHNTKGTGGTVAKSQALEQEFITLMNQATTPLVSNTVWKTVHGGDASGQYSTTNDLVTLWDHFVRNDDGFVNYVGQRSHTFTVFRPDGTQQDYTFTKSYSYYPGAEGDKSGGSTECQQCFLLSAHRLDRRVTVAFTQSNAIWNDARAILKDAYATIFRPVRTGDSGNQAGAVWRHDLSCYDQRCVTAVGTQAPNRLKVIAWRVGTTSGTVTRLGSASNPHNERAAQVAVADLDGKAFLTASVVDATRVRVIRWSRSADAAPTRVSDQLLTVPTGVDIDIRATTASSAILVVADVDGTSTFSIKLSGESFTISSPTLLAGGQNAAIATSYTARGSTLLAPNALVAVRKSGGVQSTSFGITSSSGALVKKDTRNESRPGTSDIAAAYSGPGRYSVAVGAPVNLPDPGAYFFYKRDGAGVLTLRPSGTVTFPSESQVALASAGNSSNHGVIMASQLAGAGTFKISVWEHPDALEGAPRALSLLAENSAGAATRPDIERVPGLFGFGEYATAVRDAQGRLKLILWRLPGLG